MTKPNIIGIKIKNKYYYLFFQFNFISFNLNIFKSIGLFKSYTLLNDIFTIIDFFELDIKELKFKEQVNDWWKHTNFFYYFFENKFDHVNCLKPDYFSSENKMFSCLTWVLFQKVNVINNFLKLFIRNIFI